MHTATHTWDHSINRKGELRNETSLKFRTVIEVQAWYHMPLISVFEWPRQEDFKFIVSLGYIKKPALLEDVTWWQSM